MSGTFAQRLIKCNSWWSYLKVQHIEILKQSAAMEQIEKTALFSFDKESDVDSCWTVSSSDFDERTNGKAFAFASKHYFSFRIEQLQIRIPSSRKGTFPQRSYQAYGNEGRNAKQIRILQSKEQNHPLRHLSPHLSHLQLGLIR